ADADVPTVTANDNGSLDVSLPENANKVRINFVVDNNGNYQDEREIVLNKDENGVWTFGELEGNYSHDTWLNSDMIKGNTLHLHSQLIQDSTKVVATAYDASGNVLANSEAIAGNDLGNPLEAWVVVGVDNIASWDNIPYDGVCVALDANSNDKVVIKFTDKDGESRTVSATLDKSDPENVVWVIDNLAPNGETITVSADGNGYAGIALPAKLGTEVVTTASVGESEPIVSKHVVPEAISYVSEIGSNGYVNMTDLQGDAIPVKIKVFGSSLEYLDQNIAAFNVDGEVIAISSKTQDGSAYIYTINVPTNHERFQFMSSYDMNWLEANPVDADGQQVGLPVYWTNPDKPVGNNFVANFAVNRLDSITTESATEITLDGVDKDVVKVEVAIGNETFTRTRWEDYEGAKPLDPNAEFKIDNVLQSGRGKVFISGLNGVSADGSITVTLTDEVGNEMVYVQMGDSVDDTVTYSHFPYTHNLVTQGGNDSVTIENDGLHGLSWGVVPTIDTGAGSDTLNITGTSEVILPGNLNTVNSPWASISHATVELGDGDDVVTLAGSITGNSSYVNGGAGVDTLEFTGSGIVQDIRHVISIETIDLEGTGGNTLRICNYYDLMKGSMEGKLHVKGSTDDTVDLTPEYAWGSWSQLEGDAGTVTEGGIMYNVYRHSSMSDDQYDVYIQQGITVIA
ncbi:MAG: hypothetical protein IKI22_04835, partial [Neisseriaceae bacterium]|nr:hypothetical protein [Neisseriaceae bacterium]